MDRLLSWVSDILFFLIFITVTENLLPGKKYHSYVRLCAGMILILLVLKPVIGGFHLEDQITRYFEAAAFQQETEDLSRKILGIEEERLSRVIDNYEQVVEADVDAMAREMGITPVETRVIIERDRESRAYGSVVGIRMEVEGAGEERDGAVQAVNPIEPVSVILGEEEKKEGEADPEKAGSRDSALDGEPGVGTETGDGDRMFEQFRRKVGSYYGLETGKVEIQFQGN